MARFTIATELGDINMNFRPDAAPESVAYYTDLIKSQLFDGVTFYRSDFVIQMGTHGTSKKAPKDLLRSPQAPRSAEEEFLRAV